MTERVRDPAKIDDATLCEIATLAAEHGLRVSNPRRLSELQMDCRWAGLGMQRFDRLDQLRALWCPHSPPTFDSRLIEEDRGRGRSDIELSHEFKM